MRKNHVLITALGIALLVAAAPGLGPYPGIPESHGFGIGGGSFGGAFPEEIQIRASTVPEISSMQGYVTCTFLRTVETRQALYQGTAGVYRIVPYYGTPDGLLCVFVYRGTTLLRTIKYVAPTGYGARCY